MTQLLKSPDQQLSSEKIFQKTDSPEHIHQHIEGIQSIIKKRIGETLGWLNPRTMISRLTHSMGEKLRGVFSGFFHKKPPASPPSSSTDSVMHDVSGNHHEHEKHQVMNESRFGKADAAEKEHMDSMANEFLQLQNSYRQQLSHEYPDLKMNSPSLEVDQYGEDNLMDLAAQIADEQAAHGSLDHTLEQFRKDHHIQGEILTSGFRTAGEALQKFLNSSQHHQYLTGNFSKVGCAIRSGIEQSSGRKMYYLVVLYRNGSPQEFEPAKAAVPAGKAIPEASSESLQANLTDRPHLKAYFEALQEELSQHQDVALEFNPEFTEVLKKNPTLRGVFGINLRKGGLSINYSVSDTPPLLRRTESTSDGKGKIVEVEFPDLLKDFESTLNKSSEVPAEEIAPLKEASPSGHNQSDELPEPASDEPELE